MRGLGSYLDVEKRTKGDESPKAAAVEASRLAVVVVEKRMLSELKMKEEDLVRLSLPVALGNQNSRQEPKMMMLLMMEKLVAASSVDSVAVGKIRPAELQLGSRARQHARIPVESVPKLAHNVTKYRRPCSLCSGVQCSADRKVKFTEL